MRAITRRRFVRYTTALSLAASAGGVGMLIGACSRGGKDGSQTLSSSRYDKLDPRNAGNFTTTLRLPGSGGGLFGVIDATTAPLEITARRQTLDVLAGKRTELLIYEVRAGDATYLNPVFRARRGAAVSVRLSNGLDEPTIIHWHGLHVDWRNDGHPSYAVPGGGAYEYRFTVQNRAGTYWYHPHPHGPTARQVYGGLAGLFIVEDEEEQRLRESLDLQFGVTDIPLVFQDRLFADGGNLMYPASPMDAFQGVIGDVILVNGTPNPMLEVESRIYRFRVLNGSNARTVRLILARGGERLPLHLIGTDGGLLAQPRQVSEVFVAPAERVDLLADLRSLNTGDTVFLKSHTFDPMHMEMKGMSGMGSAATPQSGGVPSMPGHGGHGGMTGNMSSSEAAASRLPDGAEFNILRLDLRRRVAYDRAIPTNLSRIAPIDTTGVTPRPISLAADGMRWLINGAQFDMERELIRTQANAVEVWDMSNAAASMPHPMHLHGFPFQVLERRGSPTQLRDLVVDAQGRVATDLGWKDTVLVWPGETVRIAIDFTHQFAGEQLYTFHCHNLEHEDGGMMVNFRVA